MGLLLHGVLKMSFIKEINQDKQQAKQEQDMQLQVLQGFYNGRP